MNPSMGTETAPPESDRGSPATCWRRHRCHQKRVKLTQAIRPSKRAARDARSILPRFGGSKQPPQSLGQPYSARPAGKSWKHFSPGVALLRRMQEGRYLFSVIPERQCVPGRRYLFAAFAAAAAGDTTTMGSRPRLHAGAATPLYMRLFRRMPVGDVSWGEPRQPRLRRSPLNDNTAGGRSATL